MTPEEHMGHRLVSEVVISIYAQWIKFHCAILLGWGMWVAVVATFTTSRAFAVFEQIGSEQAVGLPVALIASACLLCVRPERRRLMVLYGVLGAMHAGIMLSFALAAWRSTGTWVYAMLALGNGMAVVHLSGLPDTPRGGLDD